MPKPKLMWIKNVTRFKIAIKGLKHSLFIKSGKLPFRKEVGQQFPHGMYLSVFLPILTKKILKMLAMAQGLSTVFPKEYRSMTAQF